MKALEDFIRTKRGIYHYDLDMQRLEVKGNGVSDNDIIGEMIAIVSFLDVRDAYYRVEKDFGIQLYIHDDKKNMVAELDEIGNILYINEYALSVTGYAADEVSGRSWFDIFIPDHEKERISKVHQSVMEDDSQAWNCTNMIICKDGSLINVDWNNFLIKKTDDAIERVFALGVVK